MAPLESRRLLTFVVVNSLGDSPTVTGGSISLRAAITQANTSTTPTTITFDPTVFAAVQTITLTPGNGGLSLTNTAETITVTGPSVGVIINGNGENLGAVFGVSVDAVATLSNLTITGGAGGGIYNSGDVTVNDTTITGNTGGGFINDGGAPVFGIDPNRGTAQLNDDTISNNTSSSGAGILNENNSGLTAVNCTIYGNAASATSGVGGGLLNQNGAYATLLDSTVVDNSATTIIEGHAPVTSGGGIFCAFATVTLGNTIVAENTSQFPGPDITIFQSGGSVESLGNNLIGNVQPPSAVNPTDWLASDQVGNPLAPLVPLLGPLASNGGLTQTLLPLPGSPVIDTGSNSLIPAAVSTDQRGLFRVVNSTVDIGSVEVQVSPPGLNFSSGFASAAGALTFNNAGVSGATGIVGSTIQFTDPRPIVYDITPPDITVSALANLQYPTNAFDTTFSFSVAPPVVGGDILGDEVAFHIGGVSVPFDFGLNEATYPTTTYKDSTGLNNGGFIQSVDMTSSGVNPRSGDTLRVHLSYDGTTLSESVTDTVTNAVFSTQYAVNITATDGPTSSVGFTGSTGGQEIVPPSLSKTDMLASILNWTYTPLGAETVPAPTGLNASAGASAITLNWTPTIVPGYPTSNLTYDVYRGTSASGESATPIATGLTSPTYTDPTSGLVTGETYFCTVTEVFTPTATTSSPSNEASATALGVGQTPVQLYGVPIGVGGQWSPGRGYGAAVDGNLSTFFDPANGNLTNWVGLDLGKNSTITQISYAPRGGYEFRMLGGEFQVSSTPDFSANVHTIYTVTSIPTANALTTVNVYCGGGYRYIRYTGGTQWVNIAELQVTGLQVPPALTATPFTGSPIGVGGAWVPSSNDAAAFDGNLGTYFDPANGNLSNWVGLDLGSPKIVVQLSYAPRAGYEFRMVGGKFQVSNTADFSSGVHTVYTITQLPADGLTTVDFEPAGAFRYIRYTGGNQWVNIAEMQVAGVTLPIPLEGNPIGVGGEWTPGSGYAAAFDGNLSTYFDPANGNLTNWVGLDLGSAHTISQISYAGRVGYEFRMVNARIQVSSTPDFSSNVQTIYTITSAPASGRVVTANVNPVTARYIRYIGGTQWVNIAELEVDGL